MLKCYGALEIYISGQVKLLYTNKVFCCGWQTVPNFYNTVSKKVLSNIYTTVTNKQFIRMSTCCFV